ncbi:uncharacterized protein BDR25DRAFT_49360 [Lindgomyces ingoldianus]|uniref:Uncharacterized protein n=1 Tax=Lindgomyces ingoldianus TaxID=673940 RepID=A0ACB6QTL8_9PLEO|nr:uncharacterized protein BDR25DRAFT_49360 [Lindgomyces ingoldianus]KAF2469432.1 hypothetical protein BDR25DRAFT_49360 [Lindgomyces ingoldianus]
MPSLLRHSRSYSYPPCIDTVELASPMVEDLSNIDENPFEHFLSPLLEEDDPYDGLSMSAGIIVPDGPRTSKSSKFKSTVADKWAQYVKQNHLEIHGRYHDAALDDDESFMQLDDERLMDTPHMVSQLSSPTTPKIIITAPTRGRAQEHVVRKGRSRHRTSRTLSGHRHSWREPSPELFTVDESQEEAESPTLKRTKTRKTKDGAERRRSKTEVVEKSRL